MKKTLVVMFALSVLILGLASVASAGNTPALRVNVPFAFHVGKNLLPAGQYLFEMPNTSGSTVTGATLRIQNLDGSICHILITMPAGTSKTYAYQLVFNNYGGTYFLKQVQHGIFTSDLHRSRSEKELSIAASKDMGEQSFIEVVVASSN